MNFMRGQVQKHNGNMQVSVGNAMLQPANYVQDRMRGYDGKEIVLGIRAENMETLVEDTDDAIPVNVDVVEPLGAQNLLTVTMGGDMWTLSRVPTRSRTVALNRVFVFNTCGGCFSITKELQKKRGIHL